MIFRPGSGGGSISPAEAQQMIQDSAQVLVLDVRTNEEFAGPSGHLRGALLIPVQELGERIGELEQQRGKTLLVYCRTANRSGWAVAMLEKHGFRAMKMSGGIIQWNAEGRPVAHGDEP